MPLVLNDPLASAAGLRAFLATRPWMAERAGDADVAPLVGLRTDLRQVFLAAGEGRSAEMVEVLNGLLARHRPRPSISGHDNSDWHLHLAPTDIAVAAGYADIGERSRVAHLPAPLVNAAVDRIHRMVGEAVDRMKSSASPAPAPVRVRAAVVATSPRPTRRTTSAGRSSWMR